MPPDRNPDAITTPRPFFKNGREPHPYFQKTFGPVLGVAVPRKVHCRAQGDQYFLSLGEDDKLAFPNPHPLFPAERYDWYVVAPDAAGVMLPTPELVASWADRPEALKFGWARDEQAMTEPSLDDKAAMFRYVADRDLDWKTKMLRYRDLILKGTARDAAEDEEFHGIERDIDRMATEGPPRPPNAPTAVSAPTATATIPT